MLLEPWKVAGIDVYPAIPHVDQALKAAIHRKVRKDGPMSEMCFLRAAGKLCGRVSSTYKSLTALLVVVVGGLTRLSADGRSYRAMLTTQMIMN
ncbi:hypothetical protein ColTof4_02890 [Colletotrichum tofieldiae]|nr:hypothetical protein ColTof3_08812 [Colletotrichum tofieldiae]GKT70467.1 hypothetical protein ColTof4_02890 [Colletotrichum tofieldiae]GKT93534.1 hypothetical protein Ct61P_11384 [Colletotrichum tofieldiae]